MTRLGVFRAKRERPPRGGCRAAGPLFSGLGKDLDHHREMLVRMELGGARR